MCLIFTLPSINIGFSCSCSCSSSSSSCCSSRNSSSCRSGCSCCKSSSSFSSRRSSTRIDGSPLLLVMFIYGTFFIIIIVNSYFKLRTGLHLNVDLHLKRMFYLQVRRNTHSFQIILIKVSFVFT